MKRFFVFLLSLIIAYAPAFTFASSIADSGWNITSSIVNGATTTFNATKTKVINGASVAVTGVAKITPTGPQVGKFILKTGLTLAVTVALDELVNGVDYVLDPANNSITYKDKDTSQSPASSQYTATYNNKIYYGSTIDQVCNSVLDSWISNNPINPNDSQKSSYGRYLFGTLCKVQAYPLNVEVFSIDIMPNPLYDPAAQDERKSIPVDVVGGRVVQDAAQDQAPARDYTGQVANTALAPNPPDQIVPPAEIIGQLEGSAAYPSQTTATETTTTTNPDGTTNTDKKDITIPAACDWFPQACEWFGWTREEPVNDADTSVDAQKPSAFDTSVFSTNRFQVSRQCPVPEQHTLTLSGISTNFAFDLSPLCSVLDLARPALVACSFLYAAYIVIGAARNG